jgi:hypothetical protein
MKPPSRQALDGYRPAPHLLIEEVNFIVQLPGKKAAARSTHLNRYTE